MSKLTGLGSTVTVDDSGSSARDISNDVRNFNFSTPIAVIDVTGVDKSAMERILGLADYSVELDGEFDTGTNLSHDVLSDVAENGTARAVKIQPTSGATPYLSCNTLFTDYAVTRDQQAELAWKAPGVLSDGTVPSWTNS